MEDMDLQYKYQTLAAEYSKVTAKCTVLKKAVLDEQVKNVELKDQLMETDRQLRQHQQEVDSLSFRNQQLTRRVGVLQGDLDLDQHNKHTRKKSTGKSPTHEAATHQSNNVLVLEEELMSKINENVRLNQQLSESEAHHREEVGILTSRVRQLESQLLVKSALTPPTPEHDVLEQQQISSRVDSPDLHQSRSGPCAECERRRAELRGAHSQRSEAESDQKRLQQQVAEADAIIKRLNRQIRQYSPVVDTERADWDRLNVCVGRRAEQRRAAQLSAEMGGHVAALTAALADYHTYCEQRLHALSRHGLSAVAVQLSALLLSHRFSLSPVGAALQRVTEALQGPTPLSVQSLLPLRPLADAVRTYAVFLQKVVSHQRLSLQEEATGAAGAAGGQQYVARLAAAAAVFGRLHRVLDVLARQAAAGGRPAVSAGRRLLQLLGAVLADLHTALRELSKRYTLQMTEERDSAAAGRSQDLVTTNECILTSLVAATTAAQKLAAGWAAALPWVCRLSTAVYRAADDETGASAATVALSRRAAAYVQLLDGPAGGGRGSLERSLAGSLDVEEEPTARLERCQRALTQMEQSRERWRLEFQLVKAKYESLQAASAGASAPSSPAQDWDDAAGLPGGDVTSSSSPWSDLAAREHALKAQLGEQLDDMVVRLQTADARSRHFQTECRHLLRCLTAAEETCALVQRQLSEATAARQSTQQELVTTAASYESQMAAMSDHLAGLNETLAEQRDQIDQLRYQVGMKKRGAQR